MSMVGRRENNQEKQHYRGNKLQFLSYKHGALLPVNQHEDLCLLGHIGYGGSQIIANK